MTNPGLRPSIPRRDRSLGRLKLDLAACLETADALGLDVVAIHIDMALNRLEVPHRSTVTNTA